MLIAKKPKRATQQGPPSQSEAQKKGKPNRKKDGMHRDAQQRKRTVIEQQVQPREGDVRQNGVGRQTKSVVHKLKRQLGAVISHGVFGAAVEIRQTIIAAGHQALIELPRKEKGGKSDGEHGRENDQKKSHNFAGGLML